MIDTLHSVYEYANRPAAAAAATQRAGPRSATTRAATRYRTKSAPPELRTDTIVTRCATLAPM
jgi:hypothetical protein